jgi:uncharacterized protein (TIGR02300 family)
MPEIKLGNKFDCFSCGTKFYDLGKSEPICPKCGANQKDSGQAESPLAGQASRRRRKAEVTKAVDFGEEDEPIEVVADDEMVGPADIDDADLDDEEEDLDEEP